MAGGGTGSTPNALNDNSDTNVKTWAARMVSALSLTLLLTVQSSWRVEETTLVPPGWLIEDVTEVNEDIVGVTAFRSGDGGTTATDFALIYARGGETPEVVRTSPTPIRFTGGAGTGFTFAISNPDAGIRGAEFFRRRPTGEIVSLGRFDTEPTAISCDDAVTDCLMVTDGENAEIKRWRNGAFSELPNMPSEATRFAPQGAAMHPDGGLAALWLQDAVAVMALDTGRVTLVYSREIFKRDSLKTFVEWVSREENEKDRSFGCTAVPTGWSPRGNPTIELVSTSAEFGGICELKTTRFELDLKTGTRTSLPAYPWSLLTTDCPVAGWTSNVGTLVTDCTERFEGLPTRMRAPDKARPPPRELPEAIALSPTELFVMEPKPKYPYRWYRGLPKGKGLTFYVDGPSVLTFKAKGIDVEQVNWPFGTAIFLLSMADDWHVIKTNDDAWAFVRLARIQ